MFVELTKQQYDMFFRNNDFSYDEDAVKSGLKPHKLKVCIEALILKQVYQLTISTLLGPIMYSFANYIVS